MVLIDPAMPRACDFCRSGRNNVTYSLILPWRLPLEGWWHCQACAAEAHQRRNDITAKRRIMSVQCLPVWFREWGVMSVCRTNGTTCEMMLDDTEGMHQSTESGTHGGDPCSAEDVVARWGGRVRMDHDGHIYIDMCFQEGNGVHRKSVRLQNLLEHNPQLMDEPMLAFEWPEWIQQPADQGMWTAAVLQAYEDVKKNMAPATELTDDEGDEASDAGVEAGDVDDEEATVLGPAVPAAPAAPMPAPATLKPASTTAALPSNPDAANPDTANPDLGTANPDTADPNAADLGCASPTTTPTTHDAEPSNVVMPVKKVIFTEPPAAVGTRQPQVPTFW